MTFTITPTKVIKTGDKIIHNGRTWKVITDVEQYGRETKLTEKQLQKAIDAGAVERAVHDRNLAMNCVNFTYKVK